MYNITACLLTFNEERWIDLCIEHMYDYVEEILCLDGGSTDRTVDILNKYNKVRYYVIPQPSESRGCVGWNEGDRRNILQDAARTEWILCLGCDELFDDALWDNLGTMLADPDIIGWGFHRINYFYNFKYHKPVHIPNNAGEVRIYRRLPQIRWETKNAHNFLLFNGKRLYDLDNVKNTGLLIHHLHRVGIRGFKPEYDRRRPGSFIIEEDIINSSKFITIGMDKRYKEIKLPSILKIKDIV